MNYVGKVVKDLEIIEDLGYISNSHKFVVKCLKCGRTKIMQYSNLLGTKPYGITHKSCGSNVKVEQQFRDRYYAIIQRTTKPNCKAYKNYGGRGIICEWKYFIDFYDDMYESYLEHARKYGNHNTTIERIDVNGNYCKENCIWTTWDKQGSNKRNVKVIIGISPDGEEQRIINQTKFAKENGMTQSAISMCLTGKRNKHKGWKFKYAEE